MSSGLLINLQISSISFSPALLMHSHQLTNSRFEYLKENYLNLLVGLFWNTLRVIVTKRLNIILLREIMEQLFLAFLFNPNHEALFHFRDWNGHWKNRHFSNPY